jgi:3',5'-cyclic AMP phosphodiesterase CpdA
MFTLAQVGDPHLAPLPRPSLGELASKRLLGYLSWSIRRKHVHTREVLEALTQDLRSVRPDHIAVMGDLTNIALPTEFPQALAWLRTLGAPSQVSVIPGNHDAYVELPMRPTLGLWDSYTRPDEGTDESETEYPWVRVRERVALVGVSTAIPTLPFLATGRVGESQLARLRDALVELGERGCFRVVLIHHPPLDDLTKWRKRLVDSAAFARVIEQAGAELVLHGHTHRATVAWMRGRGVRVPVVGTTSASANGSDEHERRSRYHLFRIDGSAFAWRVEMEARAIGARGGFEVVGRTSLDAGADGSGAPA